MSYIIPISDLRRKFGDVEALLPYVDRIVLTKKGRPFAAISALPEVKKNVIGRYAGVLKKTDLDDNKVWKEVEKRRSRPNVIRL